MGYFTPAAVPGGTGTIVIKFKAIVNFMQDHVVQVTIRHSSPSSLQRDVCIPYTHLDNNQAGTPRPETMISGRCNTNRILMAGRPSWWTHLQREVVLQCPVDLLRGERVSVTAGYHLGEKRIQIPNAAF